MLESLIDTYGYIAIFIGTLLEGETVLVLGGFAAFRGYLSLPYVILTAFIGSMLGDQFFFYLGRTHAQCAPLFCDSRVRSFSAFDSYTACAPLLPSPLA